MQPFLDYVDLVNCLFIHYILIWPVLGRTYHIWKSMKYNFSFITRKMFPMICDSKNEIENIIYSEKRSSHLTKVIFFPLFSLFFILLLLTFFDQTRCYLFAYSNLNKAIEDQCKGKIEESLYTICLLSKLFVDIFQIGICITFLINVLVYPLKKDTFMFKLELTSIFIIWFLSHHMYRSFLIFFLEYNTEINCIVSMVEDLFYIGIFIYLTFERNKIQPDQFNSMLYNFDIFMKNPICFNFLNNYMKNTCNEESVSLFFFLDLTLFKKYFLTLTKELQIEYASKICSEYFYNITSSNTGTSYTRSQSLSSNQQSARLKQNFQIIDFPLDVQEKVEEAIKENFEMSEMDLYKLFDEAFSYVNSKLYSKYLNMMRDAEEIKKLEKLICYFDFDLSEQEIVDYTRNSSESL